MAKTRSFLSPGFVGSMYQSKNTNRRATTAANSMTIPRTRAVLLLKTHSAASAKLLALSLVQSKAALIPCHSFPCWLWYVNPTTFLCLKLCCSQCSKGG